jgi:hypothetical protein
VESGAVVVVIGDVKESQLDEVAVAQELKRLLDAIRRNLT